MNTRAKGLAGERQAETFLVQRGSDVQARNYRTPRGEEDLIVSGAGRLAFVEGKRWDGLPRESLGQAIGALKRRRIIEVARRWLAEHPRPERPCFDVILLSGGEVVHLQDAFDGVA